VGPRAPGRVPELKLQHNEYDSPYYVAGMSRYASTTPPSGEAILLREADRAVFIDAATDTAAIVMPIVMPAGKLKLPEKLLPKT